MVSLHQLLAASNLLFSLHSVRLLKVVGEACLELNQLEEDSLEALLSKLHHLGKVKLVEAYLDLNQYLQLDQV